MNIEDKCPRCGEGRLQGWQELSEDEREVVKRLLGSAEYAPAERMSHRWCTRCWFESVDTEQNA